MPNEQNCFLSETFPNFKLRKIRKFYIYFGLNKKPCKHAFARLFLTFILRSPLSKYERINSLAIDLLPLIPRVANRCQRHTADAFNLNLQRPRILNFLNIAKKSAQPVDKTSPHLAPPYHFCKTPIACFPCGE